MRVRWLLPAWVVAFLFFWVVGGQGHLIAGHDHWCSGHLLLLAQSSLHAHFATPLGMPSEDPFGPVGGWTPYTAWPPLFPLILAVFLKCVGFSLAAARLLACALSACSAMLVVWLSRRATGGRLAPLLSLLIFAGHPAIVRYCGFVCQDTAALAWSLLLIGLFPSWGLAVSWRRRVVFCVLVAVGGLLAWQCYLVPLACALGLLLVDPGRFRQCWQRVLAPILTVVVLGVVLLKVFGYLEATWKGGAHPDTPVGGVLARRFLMRTGLDSPTLALGTACGHVRTTLAASLALVGVLVVVLVGTRLGTRLGLWQDRGAAAQTPATFPMGPFLVRALGLFPLLWLVLMPGMHEHDFQMIFAIPFLAVAAGVLLHQGRPLLRGRWPRRAYWGGIAVAFLLLTVGVAEQTLAARADCEMFALLEQDVQRLTSPDTVVVMEFVNRGAWWRIQRPVISMADQQRAAGRPYVLVVTAGETGWETHYAVLASRPPFADGAPGYLILAPRTSDSPLLSNRAPSRPTDR